MAPNVLHPESTAPEPHQKGVTALTSLPTAHNWLSLAVLLDVYSPAGVGCSMSACWDEAVVESALKMSLARRRLQAGRLHHSDRGCQYTSHASRRQREGLGIVLSMSRKGTCWDQALMEAFCSSLQEECVARPVYLTPEQARRSLFEDLEVSSNRQRRHSSLGYGSPFPSEHIERTFDVLRAS